MTLGMISWIHEEDFQRVKAKGLSFVELDVNDRVKEFLDALEQTKEYSKKYDLPVAAIGRWGSARIDENGIREEELAIEYSLIDAAAELGTGIYITGCNYVDSLSYYENCSFAIAYFEKLIAYGKEKNIKIATYNCRWNNFVCNAEAYKIIHGYLKDLYIKYDTSHCINAGGDYLQETRDWGKRFIHVHLKGAVKIEGKVYDNPPHILTQCRFKCTGKRQLLWKDRCVTAMQPVQGLLMEQKRNSQTCLFFCIFLQCIINSCICPPFFQFFQAFPAHRFFDFFPLDPHNIRIQLIQLFFHCHL